MLSKREVSQVEEGLPELDEGWWASVLADEENVQDGSIEADLKNSSAVSRLDVDWDCIKDLHDHDEIVELRVHNFNRGGLLVHGKDIQGFVPISHLVDVPVGIGNEEREEKLNGYVGRTLKLKVIECDQSQERVVLSERAALAGEGSRKRLLKELAPETQVDGIVTNVTDFGVFVDLGGVEGLIHVSELSWGRVQHPNEILKVGQEVNTLVLSVSEESERVALSYKRLFSNPWEDINEIFKKGDIVTASVSSIMRFGVFARLDKGIEGLIHVSSMKLPQDQNMEDVFFRGQTVKVEILHIDSKKRRLGLGLIDFE